MHSQTKLNISAEFFLASKTVSVNHNWVLEGKNSFQIVENVQSRETKWNIYQICIDIFTWFKKIF